MTEKRYYSPANYALVQAVQAFATTLFLCSLYFWTRERHLFTNFQNLLLNALQGFIYIGGSSLGGRLSDRIGYHRQIKICILMEAIVLAVGWLPNSFLAPYLVMIVYITFTASFWPALEALLMHVPAVKTMPERIGNYNLTWAISGAIGFFLSGVLFRWQPDSIFWISAILHGTALFFLLFPIGYADRNGQVAMDIPHKGDSLTSERKRFYLHAAWLANALGYMMYASFTALAPAIGEKFGLSSSVTIWLACTLFFTRAFSFYFFRRWEGWHYHTFSTLASAAAIPLCMIPVFFSSGLIFVFMGLFLFGIMNGLSYYQSLYYSLDYGDSKGEHGGLHEAVIGFGVLSGPLSGALGAKIWGEQQGAQLSSIAFAFFVLVCGYLFLYLLHGTKARPVVKPLDGSLELAGSEAGGGEIS